MHYAEVDYTHGGKYSHAKYIDRLREREETAKRYSEENGGAKSDDHLYVHLITHTHDDVGWLKTVDEYFTGSK